MWNVFWRFILFCAVGPSATKAIDCWKPASHFPNSRADLRSQTACCLPQPVQLDSESAAAAAAAAHCPRARPCVCQSQLCCYRRILALCESARVSFVRHIKQAITSKQVLHCSCCSCAPAWKAAQWEFDRAYPFSESPPWPLAALLAASRSTHFATGGPGRATVDSAQLAPARSPRPLAGKSSDQTLALAVQIKTRIKVALV